VNEQRLALQKVAAALDAVGVRYMVTGSVAASFYGEVRSTIDIDVVVDVTRAEDSRLIARVLAEDFDVDEDSARSALEAREPFNVIDRESLTKVDLIRRQRGADAEDVFRRRRQFDVDGQPVQVIAPEDLIVAKLLWAAESHSERQLGDVHRLLRQEIDQGIVAERARRLGLTGLLEEARDARYD
jgi:hypothetical protein